MTMTSIDLFRHAGFPFGEKAGGAGLEPARDAYPAGPSNQRRFRSWLPAQPKRSSNLPCNSSLDAFPNWFFEPFRLGTRRGREAPLSFLVRLCIKLSQVGFVGMGERRSRFQSGFGKGKGPRSGEYAAFCFLDRSHGRARDILLSARASGLLPGRMARFITSAGDLGGGPRHRLNPRLCRCCASAASLPAASKGSRLGGGRTFLS